MREVTVEGRALQIVGLRRGQIKQLRRDKGIDLWALRQHEIGVAMEEVFPLAFDEAEADFLDTVSEPDALRVFNEIVKETLRAPEEEKNS